jgi:hypothetical protein
MSKDVRMGILLSEESTKKILKISTSFKKTPEQFINDIIDSTHNKLQLIELTWDEND